MRSNAGQLPWLTRGVQLKDTAVTELLDSLKQMTTLASSYWLWGSHNAILSYFLQHFLCFSYNFALKGLASGLKPAQHAPYRSAQLM